MSVSSDPALWTHVRDVLVTLVGAYENKRYDFGRADPVEAIAFRMEQGGLTPRDLRPFIGPSGRVSEVLKRKRPLNLRMVRFDGSYAHAHRTLGLPSVAGS